MTSNKLQRVFNPRPSRKQINAFVDSIAIGDDKAFVEFVDKYKTFIDKKDDAGWTALMAAANCGRKDLVEMLLENGANINRKCSNREPPFGWTALIFAARGGRPATVQLLLKRGANINMKDSQGNTAIDHARNNGHSRLADVLAEGLAIQKKRRCIEKEARELAQDIADFSPKLKRGISYNGPLSQRIKPPC